MKKILFILAVFVSATIISCSESTSGDTITGYVDPGLTGEKKQALKSYTFPAFTCSTSGVGEKRCGAILYTGYYNGDNYVGIAAGKDEKNPKFSIQIYWKESAINTTTATAKNASEYTITVNDGTYIYKSTADDLNITITSGLDTQTPPVIIYKVSFNNSIAVTDGAGHTFTIATGNTIEAYKYPEEI